MSMNLMLQTESKRILGGLLWLVFTILSTLALWAFVDTNIEPEDIFGYISLFFTITSFIVVAIITIRPEKRLNKLVIGKTHVPPVFNASEAPSIYDVADSAFIAKELDSFYGNSLVLFGFLVGIFFPFYKLVEIIIELDIVGIALTEGIKIIVLLIFIILLYREMAQQKKDLREHIEIVWRYNSIIAHQGLDSDYKSHIEDLEDSIKLKHWEKAKYQINTLNRLYSVSLSSLKNYLPDFLNAFQFYLGQEGHQDVFQRFNFSENFQNYYFQLKILGLEHHDHEITEILDKRVSDYGIFESRFMKHKTRIRAQIDEYKALIQADGILKAKEDHFEREFNAMDLNLFHIDNIQIESKDFKKLPDAVTTSTSNEIQRLFEGVRNTTELYHKITAGERKRFKQEIEINLGKDAIKQISEEITKIMGWIFPAIVKVDKTLKSSLYAPLVLSRDPP